MLSVKARLDLEKSALFILMTIPLLLTTFLFFTNGLGANPVEAATHRTGIWALRLLILSLAVTPARIFFGWRRLIIFRRMIGLFSFAYALVHFSIYLLFDQELDFSQTAADVAKRPYITVGFSALMLMVPLAVTSNSWMLKKMGAKLWRKLHQLTYVIAILVTIHFLWLVKLDKREPAIYAAIIALLLGVRIFEKLKTAKSIKVPSSP